MGFEKRPLGPLRPVTLSMAPAEAASRLRHLPGLVFFDTARAGAGGGMSVIAAAPARVIDGGSEADWEALRAADGFAAGHVGYDGQLVFGIYENVLVHRHGDRTWWQAGELAGRMVENPPARAERPMFEARVTREAFCEMVRRAQHYIAAGDVYQVNLSHRLTAAWSGDPWALYQSLRRCSPAAHAAYLALGGRHLLSSSPETFLRMSGREISTRPIKGTRPRRAERGADERSAAELTASAKERAELVMITDLERNDLGQVCEFGSVAVTELCALESHEQVHHLVSTIEGRLRPEIDHVAALRACFPGGSITGAPKRRAREIIEELEPEARGIYCGAIGWLGLEGGSQFSIAIRTVVIEEGLAHFHVGAGIVADSIPEREWEETLDKAAGILLAARSV